MKQSFGNQPRKRNEKAPGGRDAERRKFAETGAASAAINGIFGGADAEKPAINPELLAQLTEQGRSLVQQEKQLLDGWLTADHIAETSDEPLLASEPRQFQAVDAGAYDNFAALNAAARAIDDRYQRFEGYKLNLFSALQNASENDAKRSLLLMELALPDLAKAIDAAKPLPHIREFMRDRSKE